MSQTIIIQQTENKLIVTETQNQLIIQEQPSTLVLEEQGTQGPAGQGVPMGGTTGQILAKNSGSDYDTGWIQNPAITALTGDVTASGPGSATATLASTGVTPGAYTNASITVDAKGRITLASSGSGGGAVSSVSSSDSSITVSPTTGAVDVTLPATGVTAGTYVVTGATIDSKGRVTAAQDNYYLTIVNAIIFG